MQLESKEQEISLLRSQAQAMEVRTKDLQYLKTLESTVQSQKWEEFEKLAESMRNLSHTMSKTTDSARNTMTTSQVLQY